MKQTTRTRIDELMLHFDRAAEKASHEPTDLERFEQNFTALCSDVIRPAMQGFAEVLEEHGHRIRIVGRNTTVDAGGHSRGAELKMHVLPRGSAETAGPAPGEFAIDFSADASNRKMLARVTDGVGGACGYARPFDAHPIEGVTSDLVESELLEMLRHGFECAQQKLGTEQRTTATV